MVDIDYFENINDSFGHLVGDEVLRVAAARLRAAVRPQDAVGRYGGKEFLVVLSDAEMEEAAEAAERIRDAISRRLVPSGEHKIQVTCSIGCTAYCRRTSDGVQPLIDRAERGLNRARLSGRNRVEIDSAVSSSF
jgi:diguanylate cyclase (GGDEF)-like protein